MKGARMLSLACVLLAATLLIGCSGGGEKADTAPGAQDPESAVRRALEAIAANNTEAMNNVIDSAFTPSEVGLGDIVRLARAAQEVRFEDLATQVVYDEDAREHAMVSLTVTIVTESGEAAIPNSTLLTSVIAERWYLTSPYSEYWKAQLLPSPAQWAEMQADANPALPGIYVPPHPGADGVLLNDSRDDRQHVGNTTSIPICTAEQVASNAISDPLCYPSNPPTSGPHASSAAPFRVYTQPVEKEYLVHSMEHGGVIVWYNTSDQRVIQLLTGLVEASIARGQLVLLTPYPHMEPETVAVTAWTRIDTFPAGQTDAQRILRFIAAHERRFNPEGF